MDSSASVGLGWWVPKAPGLSDLGGCLLQGRRVSEGGEGSEGWEPLGQPEVWGGGTPSLFWFWEVGGCRPLSSLPSEFS